VSANPASADYPPLARPITLADSLALLFGRLAIAALFVASGFTKLLDLAGFAQSLAAKGVVQPMLLAGIAAAVEFLGGLAIALGFKTRYAALLLIAFTVVASLLSHRFWELEDAARQLQYINFLKNLAIIGGFLVLYARGAGPLSLDRA
jgi:putative oxidoreductase